MGERERGRHRERDRERGRHKERQRGERDEINMSYTSDVATISF